MYRSKELDQKVVGVASMHEVGLQAVVIQYLITHFSDVFVASFQSGPDPAPGSASGPGTPGSAPNTPAVTPEGRVL